MVHLGVRIAWIKIWPIEKRRTKSQALLVVSWMLLVSVLALNVMLYQMAPQYMAFGSQQYCNQTASAAGDRAGMPLWKPCTANSPQLVQCHWTMDSESAAAHLCTPTVLARMYLHISAGHHYLLHLPFTIGQWMLSMAFGFTLVWQTLSKCGNGTREKNRGRAYSVDGDDNGEDGDGYHDVQEEDLAEGASRRASRTLRVGGRIWKDGRWQDVSPSGAASEEGERRGSWLGSLPKAPRESHEYLLRKDGDGLSKGVPKPARTAQHSAIRQSATAAADQSENEEGVVAQESNWWGRLLQKH